MTTPEMTPLLPCQQCGGATEEYTDEDFESYCAKCHIRYTYNGPIHPNRLKMESPTPTPAKEQSGEDDLRTAMIQGGRIVLDKYGPTDWAGEAGQTLDQVMNAHVAYLLDQRKAAAYRAQVTKEGGK